MCERFEPRNSKAKRRLSARQSIFFTRIFVRVQFREARTFVTASFFCFFILFFQVFRLSSTNQDVRALRKSSKNRNSSQCVLAHKQPVCSIIIFEERPLEDSSQTSKVCQIFNSLQQSGDRLLEVGDEANVVCVNNSERTCFRFFFCISIYLLYVF